MNLRHLYGGDYLLSTFNKLSLLLIILLVVFLLLGSFAWVTNATIVMSLTAVNPDLSEDRQMLLYEAEKMFPYQITLANAEHTSSVNYFNDGSNALFINNKLSEKIKWNTPLPKKPYPPSSLKIDVYNNTQGLLAEFITSPGEEDFPFYRALFDLQSYPNMTIEKSDRMVKADYSLSSYEQTAQMFELLQVFYSSESVYKAIPNQIASVNLFEYYIISFYNTSYQPAKQYIVDSGGLVDVTGNRFMSESLFQMIEKYYISSTTISSLS